MKPLFIVAFFLFSCTHPTVKGETELEYYSRQIRHYDSLQTVAGTSNSANGDLFNKAIENKDTALAREFHYAANRDLENMKRYADSVKVYMEKAAAANK